MRAGSPRWVPAAFGFPPEQARRECWGRLVELSASGARLASLTRLRGGDSLTLRFELPDGGVEGLRAAVVRARRDADGYWFADLRFPEARDRVRLGRSLSRVLAAE